MEPGAGSRTAMPCGKACTTTGWLCLCTVALLSQLVLQQLPGISAQQPRRRGLLQAACLHPESPESEAIFQSCLEVSHQISTASAESSVTVTPIRDSFVLAALHSCSDGQQVVRISYGLESNGLIQLEDAGKAYQQRTGVQVQTRAAADSVAALDSEPQQLTAWVLEGSDLASSGARKALELSSLMHFDRQYAGDGLTNAAKTSAAWGGAVLALPLATRLHALYVRHDLFQRINQRIPATWSDVAALAERLSGKDIDGDGQPEVGFCAEGTSSACPAHGSLVSAILGSMVQATGASQGAWLDPDSLQPLFTNAAMERALAIFSRLRLGGLPEDAGCSHYLQAHASGRCLMTFGPPEVFKVGTRTGAGSAVYGLVRTAPAPGSEVVWSRRKQALLPCSAATCPHAVVDNVQVTVSRHVNLAPPMQPIALAINASARAELQLAAFYMMSELVSHTSAGHPKLAVSPAAPWADPIFNHELSVAQLRLAGYHADDAKSYLEVMALQASSHNTLQAPRLPNGHVLRGIFDALVYNVTSRGQPPVHAFAAANAAVSAWIAASGGKDVVRAALRKDLGIGYSVSFNGTAPGTPPSPPGSSGRQGGSSDRALDASATTALAVGLCLGFITLLLALLVARRVVAQVRRQRDMLAQLQAPGPGPDTTILVTDIEGSTNLWESLPASVMDQALQLHHRVLRELMVSHSAYESATEGDSFIMAFDTPEEAMMFAVNAQQALLTQPWPEELMASPFAATVVARTSGMLAAAAEGASLFGRLMASMRRSLVMSGPSGFSSMPSLTSNFSAVQRSLASPSSASLGTNHTGMTFSTGTAGAPWSSHHGSQGFRRSHPSGSGSGASAFSDGPSFAPSSRRHGMVLLHGNAPAVAGPAGAAEGDDAPGEAVGAEACAAASNPSSPLPDTLKWPQSLLPSTAPQNTYQPRSLRKEELTGAVPFLSTLDGRCSPNLDRMSPSRYHHAKALPLGMVAMPISSNHSPAADNIGLLLSRISNVSNLDAGSSPLMMHAPGSPSQASSSSGAEASNSGGSTIKVARTLAAMADSMACERALSPQLPAMEPASMQTSSTAAHRPSHRQLRQVAVTRLQMECITEGDGSGHTSPRNPGHDSKSNAKLEHGLSGFDTSPTRHGGAAHIEGFASHGYPLGRGSSTLQPCSATAVCAVQTEALAPGGCAAPGGHDDTFDSHGSIDLLPAGTKPATAMDTPTVVMAAALPCAASPSALIAFQRAGLAIASADGPMHPPSQGSPSRLMLSMSDMPLDDPQGTLLVSSNPTRVSASTSYVPSFDAATTSAELLTSSSPPCSKAQPSSQGVAHPVASAGQRPGSTGARVPGTKLSPRHNLAAALLQQDALRPVSLPATHLQAPAVAATAHSAAMPLHASFDAAPPRSGSPTPGSSAPGAASQATDNSLGTRQSSGLLPAVLLNSSGHLPGHNHTAPLMTSFLNLFSTSASQRSGQLHGPHGRRRSAGIYDAEAVGAGAGLRSSSRRRDSWAAQFNEEAAAAGVWAGAATDEGPSPALHAPSTVPTSSAGRAMTSGLRSSSRASRPSLRNSSGTRTSGGRPSNNSFWSASGEEGNARTSNSQSHSQRSSDAAREAHRLSLGSQQPTGGGVFGALLSSLTRLSATARPSASQHPPAPMSPTSDTNTEPRHSDNTPPYSSRYPTLDLLVPRTHSGGGGNAFAVHTSAGSGRGMHLRRPLGVPRSPSLGIHPLQHQPHSHSNTGLSSERPTATGVMALVDRPSGNVGNSNASQLLPSIPTSPTGNASSSAHGTLLHGVPSGRERSSALSAMQRWGSIRKASSSRWLGAITDFLFSHGTAGGGNRTSGSGYVTSHNGTIHALSGTARANSQRSSASSDLHSSANFHSSSFQMPPTLPLIPEPSEPQASAPSLRSGASVLMPTTRHNTTLIDIAVPSPSCRRYVDVLSHHMQLLTGSGGAEQGLGDDSAVPGAATYPLSPNTVYGGAGGHNAQFIGSAFGALPEEGDFDEYPDGLSELPSSPATLSVGGSYIAGGASTSVAHAGGPRSGASLSGPPEHMPSGTRRMPSAPPGLNVQTRLQRAGLRISSTSVSGGEETDITESAAAASSAAPTRAGAERSSAPSAAFGHSSLPDIAGGSSRPGSVAAATASGRSSAPSWRRGGAPGSGFGSGFGSSVTSPTIETVPEGRISFGRSSLASSAYGSLWAGSANAYNQHNSNANGMGGMTSEVVLFRGLRVRMGMATGILSASEVAYNNASKRVTYSGQCLTAAKVISDAGHGGQIMLGASTFEAMPREVWEDGGCLLLHFGSHHLKGMQRHMQLFSAFPRGLLGRAVLLEPPRSKDALFPTVLEAPVGMVAVVTVEVVGSEHLMSWGLEAACGSLDALSGMALQLARDHHGYMVPSSPGTLQAVFASAEEAASWALQLGMKLAQQQEASRNQLVDHFVLARNTSTEAPAAQAALGRQAGRSAGAGVTENGGMQEGQMQTMSTLALLEGLQVRAGIDYGHVKARLTLAGRVQYAGVPVLRSRSLAACADPGRMLMSTEALDAINAAAGSALGGAMAAADVLPDDVTPATSAVPLLGSSAESLMGRSSSIPIPRGALRGFASMDGPGLAVIGEVSNSASLADEHDVSHMGHGAGSFARRSSDPALGTLSVRRSGGSGSPSARTRRAQGQVAASGPSELRGGRSLGSEVQAEGADFASPFARPSALRADMLVAHQQALVHQGGGVQRKLDRSTSQTSMAHRLLSAARHFVSMGGQRARGHSGRWSSGGGSFVKGSTSEPGSAPAAGASSAGGAQDSLHTVHSSVSGCSACGQDVTLTGMAPLTSAGDAVSGRRVVSEGGDVHAQPAARRLHPSLSAAAADRPGRLTSPGPVLAGSTSMVARTSLPQASASSLWRRIGSNVAAPLGMAASMRRTFTFRSSSGTPSAPATADQASLPAGFGRTSLHDQPQHQQIASSHSVDQLLMQSLSPRMDGMTLVSPFERPSRGGSIGGSTSDPPGQPTLTQGHSLHTLHESPLTSAAASSTGMVESASGESAYQQQLQEEHRFLLQQMADRGSLAGGMASHSSHTRSLPSYAHTEGSVGDSMLLDRLELPARQRSATLGGWGEAHGGGTRHSTAPGTGARGEAAAAPAAAAASPPLMMIGDDGAEHTSSPNSGALAAGATDSAGHAPTAFGFQPLPPSLLAAAISGAQTGRIASIPEAGLGEEGGLSPLQQSRRTSSVQYTRSSCGEECYAEESYPAYCPEAAAATASLPAAAHAGASDAMALLAPGGRASGSLPGTAAAEGWRRHAHRAEPEGELSFGGTFPAALATRLSASLPPSRSRGGAADGDARAVHADAQQQEAPVQDLRLEPTPSGEGHDSGAVGPSAPRSPGDSGPISITRVPSTPFSPSNGESKSVTAGAPFGSPASIILGRSGFARVSQGSAYGSPSAHAHSSSSPTGAAASPLAPTRRRGSIILGDASMARLTAELSSFAQHAQQQQQQQQAPDANDLPSAPSLGDGLGDGRAGAAASDAAAPSMAEHLPMYGPGGVGMAGAVQADRDLSQPGFRINEGQDVLLLPGGNAGGTEMLVSGTRQVRYRGSNLTAYVCSLRSD